ncbi:hypothetical protein AJ87_02780 [Rhizobium yanglingense]|nr:hypothetical protein AJ87_02780 [Rhizobium yanglingense]
MVAVPNDAVVRLHRDGQALVVFLPPCRRTGWTGGLVVADAGTADPDVVLSESCEDVRHHILANSSDLLVPLALGLGISRLNQFFQVACQSSLTPLVAKGTSFSSSRPMPAPLVWACRTPRLRRSTQMAETNRREVAQRVFWKNR